MSRLGMAVRLMLGGGGCGGFLGIFAGGGLGALVGWAVGDVSLGLAGALLGACIGGVGGTVYGAVLLVREQPDEDEHEASVREGSTSQTLSCSGRQQP